jgi:RNA polymerase sigma factor (sigma-70 family)
VHPTLRLLGMTGLLIVDWQWIFDGWGAALGIFILGGTTAVVARWWKRRKPPTTPPMPVRQSNSAGDHSPTVQVGGNVGGGISIGGLSDADKKDIAHYLFDQMREEGFLPAVAPETTPQQLAFQEEEAKYLLAKAVNTLPEREKIVFTLRYYEGLSIAEIADVVGLSTSTIYRYHRTGLQLLAEKVGPAFDISKNL